MTAPVGPASLPAVLPFRLPGAGNSRWIGAACVAALLGLWWLATARAWVPPLFLPGPAAAGARRAFAPGTGKGHVPGALHAFLPELPARLSKLPRAKPIAVYCDSGYRASTGASLLQANGFDAMNVPGSWQVWKAWKALGLPVQGAN